MVNAHSFSISEMPDCLHDFLTSLSPAERHETAKYFALYHGAIQDVLIVLTKPKLVLDYANG